MVPNTCLMKRLYNVLILIFIPIVLLMGVFFFVEWRQAEQKLTDEIKQKNSEMLERKNLLVKLDNISYEFDALSEEYTSLDTVLAGEREEIKRLRMAIMNYTGEREQLMMKVAELQEKLEYYKNLINELLAKNENLNAQAIYFQQKLDSTEGSNRYLLDKNRELTQVSEELSKINVVDFSVIPLRVKGGVMEDPVYQASKVRRIKISFRILANEYAEDGVRQFFVRISAPDGLVLSKSNDDANSFRYRDSLLVFTVKQDVYYDRKEQFVNLYWDKAIDFAPGQYYVNLFCDNQKLKSTTFILN